MVKVVVAVGVVVVVVVAAATSITVYIVLCAWSAGRYRAFKILSLTRARKDVLKPWQDEWYASKRILREGLFGAVAREVIFTKNGLIGLIKDERVRLSKYVYILTIYLY